MKPGLPGSPWGPGSPERERQLMIQTTISFITFNKIVSSLQTSYIWLFLFEVKLESCYFTICMITFKLLINFSSLLTKDYVLLQNQNWIITWRPIISSRPLLSRWTCTADRVSFITWNTNTNFTLQPAQLQSDSVKKSQIKSLISLISCVFLNSWIMMFGCVRGFFPTFRSSTSWVTGMSSFPRTSWVTLWPKTRTDQYFKQTHWSKEGPVTTRLNSYLTGSPVSPGKPTNPGGPFCPGGPGGPGLPTGPAGPGKPTMPGAPLMPGYPGLPVAPRTPLPPVETACLMVKE